eukprot:jgi/Tetstr1/429826/TSEL_019693.t1
MGSPVQPRSYDAMLGAVSTLIHRQTRPKGLQPHQTAPQSTRTFLQRLGIEREVQQLSVIHVAGTKGKGSTCCMVESMLRHSDCRTGLYTSPHLVDIRERIRLQGKPAEEDVFLENFWWTFDTLTEKATDELGMPFFFEFMTLLALRVFVQQKVDVAVLEVGIGGRIDATNIVDHPAACGITALGFDHMEILGDTLPKIAFEKAGIMKPGAPAVTGPQQDCAMQVLKDRAAEVGCDLALSTPLERFSTPGSRPVVLGLAGDHQRDNAAVAVQLAARWMRGASERAELAHLKPLLASLERGELPPPLLQGLAAASWPGRAQVIHDTQDGQPPSGAGVSFYLDGAHTPESIAECAKWFASVAGAPAEAAPAAPRPYNVLLFYTMQKRNPVEILSPLHSTLAAKGCHMDHALFVPLDSCVTGLGSGAAKPAEDLAWQGSLGRVWEQLRGSQSPPAPGPAVAPPEIAGAVRVAAPGARTTAIPGITGAVDALRVMSRQNNLRVKVLVTGSLYLVGDMIKLLKGGAV